jgi:hypothetical protein
MATLAIAAVWLSACDSSDETGGSTTSSGEDQGMQSGDVDGTVGTAISVAEVRITVRSLEETFQPAQPVQRLSEATPTAPAAGESFYQAYVRVENKGVAPVRVDPTDFVCLAGSTAVAIEPTRSGPLGRSLLKNTTLDLILTFKSTAGYVPELLYSPSWYKGTIRVTPTVVEETTTT